MAGNDGGVVADHEREGASWKGDSSGGDHSGGQRAETVVECFHRLFCTIPIVWRLSNRPALANPHQRSFGKFVIKRQQVVGGQMDAAAGVGASESGFVAGAVDVDETLARIDVATAIEAGFQTFEPQDAVGDGGERLALPGVSNEFAAGEGGTNGPSAADFFDDTMKTAR